MADRAMIISWGHPVRGREQQSLEVFGEAIAFYGELRDSGRLAGFDVVILDPNPLMSGCFVLQGTHAQLDAIRENDRGRRLLTAASLVVEDLNTAEGFATEGLEHTVTRFAEAVQRVPQMA